MASLLLLRHVSALLRCIGGVRGQGSGARDARGHCHRCVIYLSIYPSIYIDKWLDRYLAYVLMLVRTFIIITIIISLF